MAAVLHLYEDTSNGTGWVGIKAPDAVTTNSTLTLPEADDILVGKATTDTLTNKTLTTPKINTSINDSNGNEIIITPATSSAVNELTITNAATGVKVAIDASGGDTDVGLTIRQKGDSNLELGSSSSNADLYLYSGRTTYINSGTGNVEVGDQIDMNDNSIGFTMQTATGDGTTTVDWKLGNHIDFTFGAFNETFTFTAPANPAVFTMSLKQDGTGSRTATWPATVKWAGGTAPTLTTTATTGYDLISFRYDGSYYYSTISLDFS